MKIVNTLCYPSAYLEAAKKHIYPAKRGRIGVTQLIDSPQIRSLWIERFDDVTLDVDDMFVSMLGTAFHKYLEDSLPEGSQVAERKLEYEIEPGITLVGKADVSGGGRIEDYKLMAAFSYVFDKTVYFEQQLNILRWLLYKVDGTEIKELIIHIFVKDWSFYESQKNVDYPQSRYIKQKIACWPLEKIEKFVRERVELHKNKDYKCTDEDKWIRLEKFAVMNRKKPGKAVRLLDTQALAEAYIKEKGLASPDIYIQQRKTDPKRCVSFCSVRSVCEYAKGLRNEKN
jgi:hypothetical protein